MKTITKMLMIYTSIPALAFFCACGNMQEPKDTWTPTAAQTQPVQSPASGAFKTADDYFDAIDAILATLSGCTFSLPSQ